MLDRNRKSRPNCKQILELLKSQDSSLFFAFFGGLTGGEESSNQESFSQIDRNFQGSIWNDQSVIQEAPETSAFSGVNTPSSPQESSAVKSSSLFGTSLFSGVQNTSVSTEPISSQSPATEKQEMFVKQKEKKADEVVPAKPKSKVLFHLKKSDCHDILLAVCIICFNLL